MTNKIPNAVTLILSDARGVYIPRDFVTDNYNEVAGKMMHAYIKTKARRPDGSYDSYLTVSVECKEAPLRWQDQGLSFTASGYGSRIPTRYMVKYNGKWRRVYCIQHSNAGTCFIGKKYDSTLTVGIDYNSHAIEQMNGIRT